MNNRKRWSENKFLKLMRLKKPSLSVMRRARLILRTLAPGEKWPAMISAPAAAAKNINIATAR